MEIKPTQSEPAESVNIFADFTDDKKLKEDIVKIEEKKKKTTFYYVGYTTNILKTVNIFLTLIVALFFTYNLVQKSENIDLSLLSPVCFIFLGDVQPQDGGCTGANSFLKRINEQISEVKKQQYTKIVSIIGDLYASENFIYSKEISFLIDKSKSRVKPLQILQDFDSLKNQFEPYEKQKISCYDLTFSEGNSFKATCEAYSSDWDSKIVGFTGDKSNSTVQGTSVSVANSFLNFLQENATSFTLVNRQKTFSSIPVNDDGPYTKKTIFSIELTYNSDTL